MSKKRYSRNQHCTSKRCPYTQSHTGNFCWRTQKRKCPCVYCKQMRKLMKTLTVQV